MIYDATPQRNPISRRLFSFAVVSFVFVFGDFLVHPNDVCMWGHRVHEGNLPCGVLCTFLAISLRHET
jgi:hypothetical protein